MTRRTRYLSPLMLSMAVVFTGVLAASARPAPQAGAANNRQAEIGLFDRFLDTHPSIAQAVAKDPSLIDNPQYVASQPALRAFLQDHPEISTELRTNPQVMMKDLVRLNNATSADGLSRAQLNTLDKFLDSNPVIAKQLEANPSLIDSRDYLKAHPELVTFLRNNPDLGTDWRSNPQLAMKGVAAVDAQDATHATPPEREGDALTRSQVAALDKFMDSHPEITRQLEANPSLIDSRAYLNDHPELISFLQQHPDLREDWRENPQAAMKALTAMDAAQSAKDPTPPEREGDALTRSQVAALDNFMDAHPEVTRQLEANPSLINNRAYLNDHPELVSFLQQHPDLREDWTENPQAAMNALTAMDAAQAKASKSGNPGGRNPGSGQDNDALSNRQGAALDAFLDAHPTLGDQLQSNPSLIDNKTFLNDHPELVAFLQSNPDLAEDWRSNPQAAMNDLARIDALQARTGSASTTQVDVAKFDAFLDTHLTVSEQLRAHPGMINDSAYLKVNPELKAFLANNPGIVAQLKADPALFMRDVQKLDTHDIATASRHGAEVRGPAAVHK